MNRTNALGFLALGFLFAVAPFAVPGWFPHNAIDGSSTRALWIVIMGIAQVVLGGWVLFSNFLVRRLNAQVPNDAAATISPADWVAQAADAAWGATGMAIPEPADSVTLHGEHADLWRAFNYALRNDGHARQLAARLVSLAQAHAATSANQEPNVVPFAWEDEAPRETSALATNHVA